MADKILPKDKTEGFIQALGRKFVVVAPVERKDAPAEFKEIGAGDKVILDGSQMMMPPKDYLLPRYETLLKVSTRPGEVEVQPVLPDEKPRVMLGMWLPDAQAIQVLDKVFLEGKFRDPYYAARRANTMLVAVMPAQMRWSWFCASTDDVEKWKPNVDAIMYDLGDRFYIEVTSPRGEALVEWEGLAEPSSEDVAGKDRLWEQFKSHGVLPFSDGKFYEQLAWDHPIWAEIAQKCIGCGVCSYMCPSCSCFDIQDEVCGTCVERYRCRDTCQFEDFTLMGSGHNPRPDQLPRSRQRLMHKFKYQHEQYGVVGCTGCGRCVELCPVNVDIREVLNKVCAEKEPEPAV
ncbi:MAG: 4Fe-4S dicluster domain-containing protein [Armatimonadota bacterium]|nr:4Fe-4S dicluster domain-containing protein [Armatimonadota bacterium]